MKTKLIVRAYDRAFYLLGEAITAYARAHRAAYDSNVADDGVLGDCGIAPILAAYRALLDGETGSKDGGYRWDDLEALARECGWKDLDAACNDAK